MHNPALPHGLDRSSPSLRLERQRRSAEKKRWSVYAANPLISLVSDEEIQGNPRESKPHFRALRGKAAMSQENPKPIERAGCPGGG
jgi:hypothetical protein